MLLKRLVVFSFLLFSSTQAKVKFGNKTSTLKLNGANSYLVVNEPITGFSGTFKAQDNIVGRVTGSEIYFDKGAFSLESASSISLTGTYSPSQETVMVLENNNSLELMAGTFDQEIIVKDNSTATVYGSSDLTKSITLEGGNSTLRLGLQSQVSKDINLNGGKIILDDNLSMKAGTKFVGGGTIDINGRSLHLPKGEFATGPMTYISANDISLNGNTNVTTAQIFRGANGTDSDVAGHGFFWTFQTGGYIDVTDPQHTLYLVGLHLKGWGNLASGFGYFDIDPTSTVVFQGSTIELTGDYVHDSGTLVFQGDNCKILPNGHTFTVTGQNVYFIVDGVPLIYENLSGEETNPLIFVDEEEHLKLLNGGVIYSSRGSASLDLTGTNLSLETDYWLALDSKLEIPNETPASTKVVSFTMNGHAIHFPQKNTFSEPLFSIDENVQITLREAVFDGYLKDALVFIAASSSMTFGQDVELRFFRDYTIDPLDKTFTFTGKGSMIGLGTEINFSGANKIQVTGTGKLTLRDLIVDGLGPALTHGYFEIASTATVIFERCTLKLDGNYAHSSGTIEFKEGCKIIHNGNNFDTTGLAFLKVDGVGLIYDSLGGEEKNPFTFTDDDSQKSLSNSGVIRSNASPPSLNLDSLTLSIGSDYQLSGNSQITVENATPGSPKAVSMDWAGHFLTFPSSGQKFLNFDPNVQVTFTNAVLMNYGADRINYGDANATASFGSGTQVRLFDDVTLTVANRAWPVTGDTLINGSNSTLVLDGSARITLTGSSTLTMRDLRIVVKNSDSLSILDAGSKIVFENCSLVLELAGLDISSGNIDVKGNLEVFGGDPAAVETDSKLIFSSAGDFTVLSGSTLKLGKNVEFEYKADPSGDAGVTFDTKRHFKLVDPTATLELNGCALHSTLTGLALDYGRVIVSDTTSLISDGSSGTEAEIGSALDLFVRPAVSLNVTGTLTYNQTTFP